VLANTIRVEAKTMASILFFLYSGVREAAIARVRIPRPRA
jgi:hypothetical protein